MQLVVSPAGECGERTFTFSALADLSIALAAPVRKMLQCSKQMLVDILSRMHSCKGTKIDHEEHRHRNQTKPAHFR